MLLRDNIYKAIRRAILTCELQPGQELREQTLAEKYRVSRSPIRDSLLRLEQEKLVTVLPRQGYRVNPISTSDVEDIFGLRLLIEPACSAAAARADDVALQGLDRFRSFLNEEQEDPWFAEYDKLFHRAVADLSGNARMAAVASDLAEQFERLEHASLRAFKYDHVRDMTIQHDAIINALQDHDADRASQLSYQHAADGQTRILSGLQIIAHQWGPRFEQPAAE